VKAVGASISRKIGEGFGIRSRNPNLGTTILGKILGQDEAGREDSHDLSGLTIEAKRRTEDLRIRGETALPDFVAEKDDTGSFLGLLLGEASAEGGSQAQDIQEPS